jgi:hypothetical protein
MTYAGTEDTSQALTLMVAALICLPESERQPSRTMSTKGVTQSDNDVCSTS